MAPGRDIHVTSNAIAKAGRKLSANVKPLVMDAKRDVDKTDVGFPGFGLIGLGITAGHGEMQTYARNYLQAAAEALDRINDNLQKVARNWREAEDKSRTKVQG